MTLTLNPQTAQSNLLNVVDLVVVCIYVTRLILGNCRILRRRGDDNPMIARRKIGKAYSLCPRWRNDSLQRILSWPTTYLA
jgi:hypothetical protein